MCIQWCCKNCTDKFTKLTHHWARERCNDYFIARSRNQNTTVCPNGSWELRRAFHRHPYRGSQTCDGCKAAGRKEKKLVQSARQKANVALGQPAEYTGTIYLGELEIPPAFHENAQRFVEPEKVDAMKAKWESFSAANRHLPLHELEREWATGFAAFNNVGVNGGVCAQSSKLAGTFGQWTSGEDGNQVAPGLVGQASRVPQQKVYRYSTSGTNEQGDNHSNGAHIFLQYNPTSTTKKTGNTAFSASTHQHFPYKFVGSDTGTERDNIAAVKEASSKNTPYHQNTYNIHSQMNDKNGGTNTVEGTEASQHPDRGNVHDSSTSTTRSASSQPTRARPWDL